jgi:hypothetical protein
MDRPPCWPDRTPCPNNCAAQLYKRVVHNETPLYGPWTGWRMAGAILVSPHRDRISALALDRLLYRVSRFGY